MGMIIHNNQNRKAVHHHQVQGKPSWPVRIQNLTSEIYDIFDIFVGFLSGGSARSKASTYTGQHNTTQHNTEKRIHISMPREGFEPTIPAFMRPKIVRALDGAATGTGITLAFIGYYT